jgi:hypothetical protein
VPVTKVFDIPDGPVVHSHTDLWMHRNSKYRDRVRAWMKVILAP